jgi:hypothetical protein
LEPRDAHVEQELSTDSCRESTLRREISKLKRLLADKTVGVDFFRGALQKVEARRQQSGLSGEKAFAAKAEMPLQGSLSIERVCQLAQVSRTRLKQATRSLAGWAVDLRHLERAMMHYVGLPSVPHEFAIH